jgi:hypothetical protein
MLEISRSELFIEHYFNFMILGILYAEGKYSITSVKRPKYPHGDNFLI